MSFGETAEMASFGRTGSVATASDDHDRGSPVWFAETIIPSANYGNPLAGPWEYRVERGLAPSAPDFATQPRNPSADNPNSPSVLYGAMLAPLTPLSIRGAIWYQGESNAGAAHQYRTLFPAMIRDWRRAWGRGDFPFLFVQLADYMPRAAEPGDSGWASCARPRR